MVSFEIFDREHYQRFTRLGKILLDYRCSISSHGKSVKNSFDLRLEHIQRVSIPSKAEGTRTSLQGGDLLFSITGDVGMLGLIPDGFEKAYINQHTAMIRFLPQMRNKYIPYLLLTDYAQKFYNANQHGIKIAFDLIP